MRAFDKASYEQGHHGHHDGSNNKDVLTVHRRVHGARKKCDKYDAKVIQRVQGPLP